MSALALTLLESIDRLLPQTQCRRCGYDDCHDYASAVARGDSEINRCPPGGNTTIQALATLLQRAPLPLADDLEPMRARQIVRIDPKHCIGCTKCILACPVDAIVGAPRFQHQVLTDRCTGCELCLPPCPTDCIEVLPLPGDWQQADAARGRRHHQQYERRLAAEQAREQRRGRRVEQARAADGVRQTAQADTLTQRPAPHRASRADHAHAAQDTRPAPAVPTTAATPATEPSLQRDPLIALAAADEKARRLAAIRDRLKTPRKAAPRP